MYRFTVFYSLLAFLLPLHSQMQQQRSYRAAAYERLDPFPSNASLERIMLDSAGLYEEQAERASKLGADILIFPEYGITGLSIPKTRESMRPYLQFLPWLQPGTVEWNPCLEEADTNFNVAIMKRLSCAAFKNSIILVANLGTFVSCTSTTDNSSCPLDGFYQFNSNVVFGKNGTVLAVYHKKNLYHEPMFDFPPFSGTQITTFETDFATFGLLTCFDILWFDPTIQMVNAGIRNLLMPTAWIDGMPFLTSVQIQMAWAIGLNVNIIAANIQKSADGFRGSGIYSGQHGFLTYIFADQNRGTLLIAYVPNTPPTKSRINQKQDTDILRNENLNYTGIIYDDLSGYTFLSLNTRNQTKGSAQVSAGTVRCFVVYEFDRPVVDGEYFLSANQGNITLGSGAYILAVEVCALLWCRGGDITQCSQGPVTSTSKLTSLLLRGDFNTEYIYPSILENNLQLIDTSEWSFTKINVKGEREKPAKNIIELFLDSDTCPILQEDSISEYLPAFRAELKTINKFSHRPIVASLYGRRYERDSQ